MTPIEETIQRLMEPDKHGKKGEPVRGTLADFFGHPVQRTLDALWKFAEGTALAARDNKDHYDSAVARIAEVEAQYGELIYAVSTKYPDETRHHTALRYIQQAENREASSACQLKP